MGQSQSQTTQTHTFGDYHMRVNSTPFLRVGTHDFNLSIVPTALARGGAANEPHACGLVH